MRLLNVNTRQLEEFFGDAIPPYAILSHTWGKGEVTLQDLSREGHQRKQGYAKIEGCCQQAIKVGLSWIWVDTCCIDKTSSAELSEAINSMFRWYEHSWVCYAYLQDVPSGTNIYQRNSAFRKSRWFTRGWTLQELLAPQLIEFYDTNWILVPYTNPKYSSIENISQSITIASWLLLLQEITSIPMNVIKGTDDLQSISAVCKFSWMARRNTTRVEDEAYCLLGLLNINMPLLYGEGSNAFIRLQEAVLSTSDDISLLAWGYHSPCTRNMSYLAKSPVAFLDHPTSHHFSSGRRPRIHTTVTGRGLHTELFMIPIDARNKVWLGIVGEEMYEATAIAIVLQQIPGGDGDLFTKVNSCPPVLIRTRNLPRLTAWTIRSKQIYIVRHFDPLSNDGGAVTSTILERLLVFVQYSSRASVFEQTYSVARGPSIEVGISFIPETGYSFSSSWPPVSESSLSPTQRPSFICSGPHTNVFYMIFSNEKQNRFVVRLSVKYDPWRTKSLETAFCVLNAGYSHTALQHCCGRKIDSKVPQFAKDMRWSSSLAARNVTTDESGHVYARTQFIDHGASVEGCQLIWRKGPYSERRLLSGAS